MKQPNQKTYQQLVDTAKEVYAKNEGSLSIKTEYIDIYECEIPEENIGDSIRLLAGILMHRDNNVTRFVYNQSYIGPVGAAL